MHNLLIINYFIIYIFSTYFVSSGDVRIISSLRPVFITILARFALKEPCGLFELFNIPLSLLGIFFVMQPPFVFGEEIEKSTNEDNEYGHFFVTLVVFLGMFAGSIAAVASRALKVGFPN